MNMLDTPITLVVPFVLLIWSLSSTSFSKFFLSTSIFIVTFIYVGWPLSRMLYMYNFERLFPGERPWAGDGLGMMIAKFFYVAMSLVSWIVALILTSLSISKS